ncbi:hypothetical protein M5689_002904 [Euphorbia peplus]|nr:hypothetical protein M5689_002904 [Euphorbia peplus]
MIKTITDFWQIAEDLWQNPLPYFNPYGDDDAVLSRRRAKYLRMIKESKFLTDAQKHRFLEGKKLGSSPDLALSVANLIQKYQNRRPSETNEGQEAIIFHADMKLITHRMFGRPFVNSFSKMISDYYKEKYDVDLHVVKVSQSSEGQSVSPDSVQCAKWFHVNKANVKEDVESEYFAELVVFNLRFTPLQCCVTACIPANVSGNSCICSFQNPSLKVIHPSLEAFHDSYVIPALVSLRTLALDILDELAGNKRRMMGGPTIAFLTSPSQLSPRIPRMAFHINFKAKLKDHGGDSEKLYFAQVVEVSTSSHPVKYFRTVQFAREFLQMCSLQYQRCLIRIRNPVILIFQIWIHPNMPLGMKRANSSMMKATLCEVTTLMCLKEVVHK